MHGYIHIYICKYMYIYIYVYIYAYAHMYIYISTTRTCAPVQRCSSFLAMEAIAKLSWVLPCHGSYCEIILSLARTSCRLSFPPALLPLREPAALMLARSQTCSLKKSDQIHDSSWRGRRCSVAQASAYQIREQVWLCREGESFIFVWTKYSCGNLGKCQLWKVKSVWLALECFYSIKHRNGQPLSSTLLFLSFFLGWWGPNLITGQGGTVASTWLFTLNLGYCPCSRKNKRTVGRQKVNQLMNSLINSLMN